MTSNPARAAAIHTGLHIFPLKPGTKSGQLLKSWTNEATDNLAQIERWLERWPNMNYGIHCGQSGLIVLDADGQAAVDAVEAWASEEKWRDILDETLCVVTPGGGLHWYFYDNQPATKSQPGGNQANPITAAGERLHSVDWRSSNGYVVGPGSTRSDRHNDTYRIVQPLGWATPILDAPTQLLDACLRVFDRPTRTPHVARHGHSGDSPWERYNRDVLPEQVFEEHGWERAPTGNPNERARYRRPGATSRSSAAIYADTGGITMFSANAGVVDQHYSGSAALKAGLMYPTLSVDDAKTRFVEWLADRYATPTISAPEIGAPDDEWPDCEPVGNSITPPAFPADVLPAVLVDAATTICDALELDIDLGALIGLGCLSAVATWRNVRLDLSETRSVGPNIYQAIAMPPSAGKSPVFAALTAPVQQIATQERERSTQQQTQALQRRKIAEQRVRNAEAAAVKDPDLESAAWAALLDLERVEVPTVRRLIADDITPEALGELLADNGGNLAVISAEGDFFDGLGRYVDKGKEANISAPLKAWSGDPIMVNRAGGREYQIADPRLTMTLTVQPSVVQALWANRQFAGRGLVHRVMVAQPPHNVGRRTYDAPEADKQALAAWRTALVGIYDRLADRRRFKLTADAYQAFKAWQRANEPKLSGDWAHIASSVTKTQDTVLRVALLLHLASDDQTDLVDLNDLSRAIRIGDYWTGQMLAIQPAGDKEPARRILEWAAAGQIAEFTVRDLARAGVLRREFGTSYDGLVPVLVEMIEAGWLVPESDMWHQPRRGMPGSPLRVNPKAARQLQTTIHAERSTTTERAEGVAQSRMSRNKRFSDSSSLNTPKSDPDPPTRQLPRDNSKPPPRAVRPEPIDNTLY